MLLSLKPNQISSENFLSFLQKLDMCLHRTQCSLGESKKNRLTQTYVFFLQNLQTLGLNVLTFASFYVHSNQFQSIVFMSCINNWAEEFRQFRRSVVFSEKMKVMVKIEKAMLRSVFFVLFHI